MNKIKKKKNQEQLDGSTTDTDKSTQQETSSEEPIMKQDVVQVRFGNNWPRK